MCDDRRRVEVQLLAQVAVGGVRGGVCALFGRLPRAEAVARVVEGEDGDPELCVSLGVAEAVSKVLRVAMREQDGDGCSGGLQVERRNLVSCRALEPNQPLRALIIGRRGREEDETVHEARRH